MKIITAYFFIASVFETYQAASVGQNSWNQGNFGTVDCPCQMTFEFLLVCGTDNKTYTSPSALECAKTCSKRAGTPSDLSVKSYGACENSVDITNPGVSDIKHPVEPAGLQPETLLGDNSTPVPPNWPPFFSQGPEQTTQLGQPNYPPFIGQQPEQTVQQGQPNYPPFIGQQPEQTTQLGQPNYPPFIGQQPEQIVQQGQTNSPPFTGQQTEQTDQLGQAYPPPPFIGQQSEQTGQQGQTNSPPFTGQQTEQTDQLGQAYPPPPFIGQQPEQTGQVEQTNLPPFIGQQPKQTSHSEQAYPPPFIGRQPQQTGQLGQKHSPPFIGQQPQRTAHLGQAYPPPPFIGRQPQQTAHLGQAYPPPPFIGRQPQQTGQLGQKNLPPFINQQQTQTAHLGQAYAQAFIGQPIEQTIGQAQAYPPAFIGQVTLGQTIQVADANWPSFIGQETEQTNELGQTIGIVPEYNVSTPECPCNVTAESNPICGSDNKTYPNYSTLTCANYCLLKKGTPSSIAIRHFGPCVLFSPIIIPFTHLDAIQNIELGSINPLGYVNTTPCPCDTTDNIFPVCGSDKKTYINLSILKCNEHCSGKKGITTDLAFVHNGPCNQFGNNTTTATNDLTSSFTDKKPEETTQPEELINKTTDEPTKNTSDEPDKKEFKIDVYSVECNCITTKNIEPVCGNDDKTYVNISTLKCEKQCSEEKGVHSDLIDVRQGVCSKE